MMHVRVRLLVGLLLYPGLALQAQDMLDSLQLDAVTISASRGVLFDAGVKVQAIDSATLARYRDRDLGELLRDASPVFVKSYGMGSLATTSFRGGGASHTAVLWNGFNLGSPQNGQLDLSLVPGGLADEVTVQYGGSAALWGSGAVGGAVLLRSGTSFGGGLSAEAGASFGSFGDLRQQAGAGYSNDRLAFTVRGYRAEAENDFPYQVRLNGSDAERRQQNAGLLVQGLVAGTAWRINPRQQLKVDAWFADAERQVPPTPVQGAGSDHQHDRALRATSEWRRTGNKATSFVRGAWFDEELWWYGQGADSAAYSRARTAIAEGEMRMRAGERHLFGAGLHGTYTAAGSDGYREGRSQDRGALFASYRFRSIGRRFLATAAVRQEWADGVPVPFTWSLGGEYRFLRLFTAKANASRLYRLPTLNDLYWIPGGNPELLAEQGYAGELGLLARHAGRKGTTLEAGITGYRRVMDNWIIWLPAGNYWSPQNLMEVWSRGIEFHGEAGWRMGRTRATVGVMTSYARSTNERPKTANDASVGKQLIYVPMYSGGARAGMEWRSWRAELDAHYTGYRYISTDNRQFLDPYTLVGASLSWSIRAGRGCMLSVLLQGANLLDASYQVMLNRPMPPRHFRAGIRMQFNQPRRAGPAEPAAHAQTADE